MNTELKKDVQLVALISVRGFFSNRRKIKREWQKAKVIPMFPGIKRWRMNGLILKMLPTKPSRIIARSVLATNIAMDNTKAKVIYDGRGAISAEWFEYNVVNDGELLSQIEELERKAIHNSDYRLSVSNSLVEHWREKFSYRKNDHVVIPCTLNKEFTNMVLEHEKVNSMRKELGFSQNDIVFVYSGSNAGWQSFQQVYNLTHELLSGYACKLLFLSKPNEHITKLGLQYPGKVKCIHVDPMKVPSYLSAADVALMIRGQSITNKVASPVKLAEYLCCGLPVIISEHLGDYTELIDHNQWGYVYPNIPLQWQRISFDKRQELSEKAKKLFGKKNYEREYEILLQI